MNTETTTMLNSANEDVINLDIVRERVAQAQSLIRAAMQYAPDILDVASDLLDEAIDEICNGHTS